MTRLERITEIEWHQRALEAQGSVAALAKSCGVSPRQLERFFRGRLDMSPIDWLNDIRLREAPALILGGKTIKEVAATLGYEDASHFTKRFKVFYGILPSHFRQDNCM